MTPCELTAGVTALANLLACRLGEAELNLLALVLTQLGDTLGTIAAQRQCRCSGRNDTETTRAPLNRRVGG